MGKDRSPDPRTNNGWGGWQPGSDTAGWALRMARFHCECIANVRKRMECDTSRNQSAWHGFPSKTNSQVLTVGSLFRPLPGSEGSCVIWQLLTLLIDASTIRLPLLSPFVSRVRCMQATKLQVQIPRRLNAPRHWDGWYHAKTVPRGHHPSMMDTDTQSKAQLPHTTLSLAPPLAVLMQLCDCVRAVPGGGKAGA